MGRAAGEDADVRPRSPRRSPHRSQGSAISESISHRSCIDLIIINLASTSSSISHQYYDPIRSDDVITHRSGIHLASISHPSLHRSHFSLSSTSHRSHPCNLPSVSSISHSSRIHLFIDLTWDRNCPENRLQSRRLRIAQLATTPWCKRCLVGVRTVAQYSPG